MGRRHRTWYCKSLVRLDECRGLDSPWTNFRCRSLSQSSRWVCGTTEYKCESTDVLFNCWKYSREIRERFNRGEVESVGKALSQITSKLSSTLRLLFIRFFQLILCNKNIFYIFELQNVTNFSEFYLNIQVLNLITLWNLCCNECISTFQTIKLIPQLNGRGKEN